MDIFKLKTPLSGDDVRKLKVGDLVYLTGQKIYVIAMTGTAKFVIDRAKEKKPLFDIAGAVIYQCPIGVKKLNDGKYAVRWVGATTSIMMEDIAPSFIELGARAIMGKGGMGEKTTKAMKDHGGVYLATTGATSSLLARNVTKIVNMYDPTIMFPLCELEVKNFGPVVVGIDSHGNNLFEDVWQKARKVLNELL